jgi:serine protease
MTLAAPAGSCVNITCGRPACTPSQTATNSGSRGPEAGGSRYSDSYGYAVGTSFAAPDRRRHGGARAVGATAR